MPPKRSESWQILANQEGKILLALQGVHKGQIKSLRAAAKLYDIPFSTLQLLYHEHNLVSTPTLRRTSIVDEFVQLTGNENK
jgi:hypothetical protein